MGKAIKQSVPSKQTEFHLNFGFFKTGMLVGAGVAFLGDYSPVISIGTGLALPQIGGKTNDEKASLFAGEIAGFITAKALPGIASSFIAAHPLLALGLAAGAGACYYRKELYDSTIGYTIQTFEDLMKPAGVAADMHPAEGIE
jgi:hypothetical protein